MLTKAYIQEVLTPHKIRVRIPLFNKIENVEGSTPNEELHIACVCALPNFVANARVGDIVIVGFEEDSLSQPVVLGFLSQPYYKDSLVDAICNDLTAKGDTNLGEFTTIGKVTPDNIKCLVGVKENIQDTIVKTNNAIDNLSSQISDVTSNISANASGLTDLKDTVSDINTTLLGLKTDIKNLNNRCDEINNTFNEYLKKYPTILVKPSYGTDSEKPSNPEPGQLYFTLKDSD